MNSGNKIYLAQLVRWADRDKNKERSQSLGLTVAFIETGQRTVFGTG